MLYRQFCQIFLCLALSVLVSRPSSAADSAPGGRFHQREMQLLHSRWGTPELLSGRFAVAVTDKRLAAIEFFDQRKQLFRLNSPMDELRLMSEKTDELGLTHLRCQQVYQGLRVWGCQTIVHFEPDGSIYLVGGQTAPTPTMSTTPALNSDEAASIAETFLKTKVHDIDLSFDDELLIYPGDSESWLCRLVTARSSHGKPVRWRVFVDAHNGEIRHAFNDLISDGPVQGWGYDIFDTVRTLETYILDGQHRMINSTLAMYTPPVEDTAGVIVTYMEGMSGPVRDINGDNAFIELPSYKGAVSGHYLLPQAYDYFYQTFGRNSWDDLGSSVRLHVNQTDDINDAFWLDGEIYCGAGDTVNYLSLSVSLDVLAHEFTHGVTETTAGLIYSFQSGALSESYSDFFGAMVDRDDWLIAEDITQFEPGFLRNMADPHQGAIPDLYPFGYQPAHMSEFVVADIGWDYGAVHINSGIPNKVGYLVSEAIGRDKSEHIWYRTLTTYLTPGSSFHFWGEVTAHAAADLHGYPSEEVSAVYDALDSVGIVNTYASPEDVWMTVSFGNSIDTLVYVYSSMIDTIVVMSAVSTTGQVDVSGVFPDTLFGYDSVAVDLSFDATAYLICDLGLYMDTIEITTTSPAAPTVMVPVTVQVGAEGYGPQSRGLYPYECNDDLSPMMMVHNTTAISDFTRDNIDGMYAATLMIGLIDGDDTVVYRALYDNKSIPPDGGFDDSTNWKNGVHSRYVQFATDGARVMGQLQYYTRYSTSHCGEVVAEYTLRNECDTPLTIVTGVFSDFDISDSQADIAGVDGDNELAYIWNSGGSRALAVAALGAAPRNLRAINNQEVIWPNSDFPTGIAYSEMIAATNTEGPAPDDWSVLLTFDTTTLGAGDTAMYRVAFLYSNEGVAGFGDMLDQIGGYADSAMLSLKDTIVMHLNLTDPDPADTGLVIRYVLNYPGGSSVPWGASHSSSWLMLSADSGLTGDTVVISAELSGLEAGVYFDTISVHSAAAVNSPQQTVIELRVNPGTGAIQVPSAHLPSIQTGIDIAYEGDSVLVAAGLYVENIRFNGVAVKLIGQGAELTTLEADDPYKPTVWVDSTAGGAELSGFTLTGSTGGEEPVRIYGSEGLRIADNIFHNLLTDQSYRSVIACREGANPTIEGNLFYTNGGGSCILIYYGSATVVNNTFAGNRVAVSVSSGTASFTNNIVASSSQYGVSGVFTELDCNDFWENDESYANGAVPGLNDFSLDPLFCSGGTHNYSLASNSPCLPDSNSCNVLIGAMDVGCITNCANRGDFDHSGGPAPIDISDLVYFVDYMFTGGPPPLFFLEGDVDGSGSGPLDIADLVYLVDYMFNGGPAPAPCP